MENDFQKCVWREPEIKKELTELLHSRHGLSLLSSKIAASRIDKASSDISEWLNPELKKLSDPYQLNGCRKASGEIAEILKSRQSILLFSDYDVDGITSAALFTRVLRQLGGNVDAFIPDRMEEGYGLSREALTRALTDRNPALLIVLDCGTRSEKELEWIQNQNIRSIVVDHHAPGETMTVPADCTVINPHIPGQIQEEYQNFCTVGLAFKVLHALVKYLEEAGQNARGKVRFRDLLDLVALGTIADLVPLSGENRILARAGLVQLRKTQLPGLQALLQVADVSCDAPLTASDVGYRVGPRINAGGRIEDPAIPLELLLTDDHRRAYDLARILNQTNEKRRSIETRIHLEASARIGAHPPTGIVEADQGWHPGVVGIVAGRIAREHHRPAIIFGWDGQQYKGSGRSVPGINLLEVMEHCTITPPKAGGHPMAMGFSLPPDMLEPFQKAFAEAVFKVCAGTLPHMEISLDAWTDTSGLNRRTFLEIENLGPFGMGNPEPTIGLRNLSLPEPPRFFGKDHIRFPLPGTEGIEVIGWRMAAQVPPIRKPVDLLVRLKRSQWKNREYLRAEMRDWRPGTF